MLAEVRMMTRDGHIPLSYVISFLHKKYKLTMDRNTLHRRFQWDERKVLPVEADAMMLISAFF